MKDIDIKISRHTQRREIVTFVVCFVIAFALNVYSIIAYKAPWTELITSIFYVITAAILIYVVWTCLRILYYAIFRKPITNNKIKKL